MSTPAPKLSPFSSGLQSLAEIAETITESSRPISAITVWRWATTGKRGVILPAIPVGRCLYSNREAVEWFFAELQARQANKALSDADTSTQISASA